MTHYIIGCGGVGSQLVPVLTKLIRRPDTGHREPEQIVLIDGDTVELKNLDRQLFSKEHIGRNKARALAEILSRSNFECDTHAVTEYFSEGMDLDIAPNDLLWCCADNHACRRAVLDTCDLKHCRALIGANEYTESEAYWYESSFRETPLDPRRFYPEILTDRSGDPLAPAGCTGQAAEASPQLVLANTLAASMMMSLYWFYSQKRPTLDADARPYWPIHHKANEFQLRTIKIKDRTDA